MNHTAIVLDTETTRIDSPEVIELAWRPLEGQTVRERFRPNEPITWGALATHHIFLSELQGCTPSAEAPKFVPSAAYWIGHNIDFDWRALGSPPSVKRICTLAMAREIFPTLDSHSLTALTYFIFGAKPGVRDMLRNAHSAAQDVDLCYAVFMRMCEIRGLETSPIEKVWEFSENARIPKKFTFGKFTGQPIAAADRGYVNWYRKQPNPDPYYLEAFRRAGLM